jgi:hypothetical protein
MEGDYGNIPVHGIEENKAKASQLQMIFSLPNVSVDRLLRLFVPVNDALHKFSL